MLTSDQFDTLTDPIVALYTEYETSILNDIARRLRNVDFSSAAWQVQRLTESGSLYKDVIKKIAQLTGKSEIELRAMFKKAGVNAISFDDKIYKAAGLNPLPLNLSPAMLRALTAGLQKTQGILSNLTLTTAINAQRAFIKAADLAYLQVSTGAMSYDQAIRMAVKKMAAEGLSTVDYASGHTNKIDVAMRRTVLTGVSQTTAVLQEQRAGEMGSDLVQVSAHVGARNTGTGPENHEAWQGKIYSRSGNTTEYPPFVESTGYGTGEGLGGWNCVLGDTLISSPAIRTAYRRKYTGEILVIHVAGGEELSITPNHPILTEWGWVNAGLLNKGDYIIKRANGDGMAGISPDVDKNISSIANIFDTLSVGRKVFTFPISSSDFHGDVSNGEVDIIFTNSFLRDGRKGGFSEHVEKRILGNTPDSSSSFFSHCTPSEVLEGALHSPNGVVGSLGELGASINPRPVQSLRHCLGAIISDRDAEFAKIPTNSPLGYSSLCGNFVFPHAGFIHGEQVGRGDIEFSLDVSAPVVASVNSLAAQAVLNRMNRALILVRDELQGMTGQIELDNIISIERKSFTGHVYNLHTEGEWYSANGIITHNCRHSFFPFFEGLSQSTYTRDDLKEMKKETVTYNGKEMSNYEGTQYQRAIERKIRYWKRQAAALDAAKVESIREIAKVKEWQAIMRDFIAQTKLDRQPIRETIIL